LPQEVKREPLAAFFIVYAMLISAIPFCDSAYCKYMREKRERAL